jgi:uncharacterized protein YpmB
LKKKTKWILLSTLIVLVVIFGLYRFYIYIHKDTWKDEQAAVLRAQQESGLHQVTKTWKSVWDEVCWVVEGKDESGQDMMVWLQDGKPARQSLLSDGKSLDQIHAIIVQKFPDLNIVRLLPGIYNNQFVWQLFYKENSHYYYRFFAFNSGEALDEVFTLPNR